MRPDAAVGLAAARIVVGVALACAPRRSVRPWLGPDISVEAAALTRMLGVRDVLLGAWLLDRRGGRALRNAAVAGAVADASDAIVAAALARHRPWSLAVAGLAVTGAAAGISVAATEAAA